MSISVTGITPITSQYGWTSLNSIDAGLQLYASVVPSNATNKSIIWTSGNNDVITVNSSTGAIVSRGYGATVITATTADGAYTSTFYFRVVQAGTFSGMSGITCTTSFGSTSLPAITSLNIGETKVLFTEVIPSSLIDNTFTWASSNTSIVNITNVTSNVFCSITGVGNGTATITASRGSSTVSFTVNVGSAIVSATGINPISVQLNREYFTALDQGLTANTSVLPSNVSNPSILWTSSAPSVISVDSNGLMVSRSVGTATITATSVDGSFTSTKTMTVSITPVTVTGIASISGASTVSLDESIGLSTSVIPGNASNQTITWSSSNTSIATVNSSGVVTGVANGTVVISATTEQGGYVANKTITVTSTVTGINSINGASSVTIGQTTTFSTSVLPNSATNKSITWSSSNTSIATIDLSGVISGIALGTATITATSVDGNYSATKTITVIATVPVTGVSAVTFQLGKLRISPGDGLSAIASVLPVNAANTSLVWSSSNTSVISINSSSGAMVGGSAGYSVITATSVDGGYSNSSIFYCGPAVTGLSDISGLSSVAIGSSIALSSSVTPSDAIITGIVWTSSNNAVATVNSSGYVTGVSTGTVTITATTVDGSFTKTKSISVAPTVPVSGISSITGSTSVNMMSSISLSASVSPANASQQTITWTSSNTSVATVNSSTGVVTGVDGGVVTITATSVDGGYTATYSITVNRQVTGINDVTFQLGLIKLTNVGDGLEAYSSVIPSNADNTSINWSSSNTSVISINSSSGFMRATGVGSSIITATSVDGGYSKSAIFYVGPDVTGLTDISGYSSVAIGTQIQLSSSVTPSNAPISTIAWSSSNTAVATIDASGNVTGLSAGTVTITGTTAQGSYTKTKTLTVASTVGVSGISSISGSSTVVTGSTITLSAAVTPGNATNQAITWSSGSPGVATVDASGVVTGVAGGSATITATTADGSYTATKSVTVTIPVTGINNITFQNGTIRLTSAGNTLFAYSSVIPNTASNPSIIWSSSNTSIISINSSTGFMTAGSSTGSTTITATSADGGFSKTATFYVGPAVTGISSITGTTSILSNGTTTFVATISPSTAVVRVVTWTSSNTAVATVDPVTGVVSGVAGGSAVITATTLEGGFTRPRTVTVTQYVPVSSISDISGYSAVAIGGATAITLSTIVSPSTATTKTITWTSSNTAVATVNSSGVVTGISNGSATITARSVDNSSIFKTKDITVASTVSVTDVADVTFQFGFTRLSNIGNALMAYSGVIPGNATNKAINWSSSNTGVISIDSSGFMTATGFGSTTITATSASNGSLSKSATFYVGPAVTGISDISGSSSVVIGSTVTLSADISPSNAANKTITWSSGTPGVATVDASGVVTGVSAGTAVITATTVDGNFPATKTITVTKPVTGISDISGVTSVLVGSTIPLSASVLPGDATNQTITWSSDSTNVATVDASGVVTGVSAGTAVITATTSDGNFPATKTVTVTQPVTGISDVSGASSVFVGSTITLSASVSPGDATNQTITWSSDATNVATVDASGVVTGVSTGTAVITATTSDGNFPATKTVIVMRPVTGISDISGVTSVFVGSTITLSASVEPGDATNQIITWSSGTTSVATVDASGVVTGVSSGTSVITATTADGNFPATKTVTVTQPVTGISDISGELSVFVGSTITLSASVLPGDATNQTITWSSDASGVATVDASGVVTGVASGTAVITATTSDGNFPATKTVTVTQPVIGISDISGASTVAPGSSITLSASVNPPDATNQAISWSSSDKSVAAVGLTSGVVTGESAGTAVITATTDEGNFIATKTIIVSKPVTGISDVSGASSVFVGSTITLSASVDPGDATNQTITWSSGTTSVATVDASGVVTGVAAGTAVITATTVEGNFPATKTVTVTQPVIGISDISGASTVAPGSTITLSASVDPANATNQAITWSSGTTSVATVDASGVVTGVAAGTSVITARTSDGNFTATKTITVTKPVTGISDVSGASSVFVGSTITLSASVDPGDATNQTITWSSGTTSVATVDASGVVTGVAAGTAVITATTVEGNFPATKTVIVTQPVIGISDISGVSTVAIGSTIPLSASVDPANATNPIITWSSATTSVATVDASGVVTGVATGTSVITARTSDGNFTATKTITVTKPVISISDISGVTSVAINSTITLSASVFPGDATNQTITWSSNATGVASVNSSTGVVTGVSAGTAVITATTADGGFTAIQTVTVTEPVIGISVISGSLSVQKNASTILTASVVPPTATNKTINWSSSNTSVATVNSSTGEVTGVAGGSVTITATTAEGSFTATTPMTVTVAVTGISDISGASTVLAGSSITLSASVDPGDATNQTITWSSSATGVATVNSSTGVVTGVAGGSATITARTASGNYTKTKVITVIVPVTGISPVTFQLGWRRLTVGAGLAAIASVTPSNATNKAITWTSSNPAVLRFNNALTGAMEGRSIGSVTVTATTADGGFTSSNTFYVGPAVTGISDISGASSVNSGSTIALTASVTPSDAPIKIINWTSSNTAVATVDPLTGVVTGVSSGTATITARTDEGNYTATKSITVVTIVPVTGVSDISGSTTVSIGSTISLSANVIPLDATDQTITWSSDASGVATVDASGTVTGVAAGTTNIRVTNGIYTSTLPITVTKPVTGISDISGVSTVAKLSTITLTAYVVPSDATNQTITWSSDASGVASVNSSTGVVTGVTAGTATITGTTEDGSFIATKTISVYVPVTGLSDISGSSSLTAGNTIQLSTSVIPSDATTQTVTWSSDASGVATVDASGVVTGVAAGTATITATSTDGSYIKTKTVTVTVAVTGITPISGLTSMRLGTSIVLSASVTPPEATNQTITWSSSNTSVATVNSSGVVTSSATTTGTTTITARTASGNFTATTIITVVRPVTGISPVTFQLGWRRLPYGAGLAAIASVSPSNATNTALTWTSSNTTVLTINASTGAMVAKSVSGFTTITATTVDGGYSSSNIFYVGPAVTGISDISGASSVDRRSTIALTASVTPSDAPIKIINWTSSNTAVATVDPLTGVVTGVSAGTATITARTDEGNYTATKSITVTSTVSVTGLSDISGVSSVNIGSTIPLSASVIPPDATNQTVTWSSDASGVATVDASGVVTGVSAGIATITASAGGGSYTKTKSITVTTPVSGIRDISGSTSVATGATITLATSVTPPEATIKTITWSSDATGVATVDASGVVTGVSGGTATITARTVDGNYTAIKVVTVFVPVTSVLPVTFQNNLIKLTNPGDALMAYSGVLPAEATNTDLIWSSSHPSVIGINSYTGFMVATGLGSTTITATSADGGHFSSATFYVGPDVIGVNDISGASSVYVGSTISLSTTVTPPTAPINGLMWSSDASGVATVDASGVVTGVSVGSATITATSVSGSYTATKDITVNPVIPVTGIEDISGGVATLPQGITMQLSAALIPSTATNSGITWSSSDSTKATVSSSGLVTALLTGEVTITATTTTGSYSKTYTFTVTSGLPVSGLTTTQLFNEEYSESIQVIDNVTYISTPVSYYNAQQYGLLSLGVEATPSDAFNKDLIYTVGDPSILSVTSAGTLVPLTNFSLDSLSYNTTTVTITSASNPSINVVYNVRVKNPNTLNTEIRLSTSSPYIAIQGGSVQILSYWALATNTQYTDADGTGTQIAWTSSDPSIATITSGTGAPTLTPVSTGDVYIIANYGNSADRILLRIRDDTTYVPITAVTGPFSTNGTFGDVVTTYTGDETYPYQSIVSTLEPINLYTITPSNASEKVVESTLSRADIIAIDTSGVLTVLQDPGVSINTTDYTNVTTNIYTLGSTFTTNHQIRLDADNARFGIFVENTNGQSSYGLSETPVLKFLTVGDSETPAGQNPWSGGETSEFALLGYTSADITWISSNESVATVSKETDIGTYEESNATIHPVSAGTVWIRCIVGKYYADRQFTITAPGWVNVTGISDISGASTLPLETTMTLSASVSPAEASDTSIVWTSSNTAVATVSSSGVVTPIAGGTTTITATANSDSLIRATKTITVTAPLITSLTIDSVANLSATILDPTAIVLEDTPGFYLNISTTPLGYSYDLTFTVSNTDVIYNDKGGNGFDVVGAGVATITVTSNDNPNINATLQVTIINSAVPATGISAITAANNRTYVAPGSTLALSASIEPAEASNKIINWTSSNTSLATVNSSGVVTGVALGNVTITATAAANNTYVSTYDLRIGVPVTGITDISGTLSVLKGQTTQLLASVTPSNASVTGITWSSSNTSVATVNSNTGLVSGIEGGSVTITATTAEGSYSKTHDLTVVVFPEEVTGISDPSGNLNTLSVPLGGTVQFSGVFVPTNTTNKNMVWQSSNPSIATVDASGVVTGVAVGLIAIVGRSVENLNLQRTATVRVYIPVTGMNPITHANTTDELLLGATLQLGCEGVLPPDAENPRYTWSTSHPDHIVVNRSMKLIVNAAMPDNSFTVTATSEDGGFTATRTFTVYRPIGAVGSITATNRAIAVALNNTIQLTLPILPPNATTQTVTWTSSNSSKISVSSTGLCTGVALTQKKEAITITASIREPSTNVTYTRTYPLTVPVNKITGLNAITVVGAPGIFVNGQSYQLLTAIVPSTASYASLGYTWSSSNPGIATVDSSGVMTVVGPGKNVKITATAVGDLTGAKKKVARTFPVITYPTSIQSPVATSSGGYIVGRGKKIKLMPVVIPSTATNTKVTFTSSDPAIATVTTKGDVMGKSLGAVTITITSLGLSSVTRDVRITVF